MYAIGDAEIEAVARVIRARTLFRYNIGQECATFERRYAEYLGTDDVALAGSGTHALTAGLIGLGVGPGDEVIVPAHTYMATALAVLSVGAIPVLVDIDDTLTIDPDAFRNAIGPHTRAVIPVHLWGTACDMDAIMAIAAEHDVFVLEDACQGVGGGYHGAMMGAIGHAGAFSFNYYKNMTAGEGGAIVSRDPKVMQRARCAIDPTSFYWTGRDEDFKPFSSNGVRATEIQGALLNVQLDRLPAMVTAMRTERDAVLEGTAHLAELGLERVRLNSAQDDVASHVFFRLPSEELTRRFIEVYPVPVAGLTGRHMYTGWDQILTRCGSHHADLNPYELPANAGLGAEYTKDSFPVTLDLANRTLMVPTDPSHLDQDVADVIHNIEMAAKWAAGAIGDSDVHVRAVADMDLQKWDMKQTATSEQSLPGNADVGSTSTGGPVDQSLRRAGAQAIHGGLNMSGNIAGQEIDRRLMLKLTGGAVLASSLGSALLTGCGGGSASSSGKVGGTLRLFNWAGYEALDISEPFRKKDGVTIESTPINSPDEILTKLKAGGTRQYSLVSPNVCQAPELAAAGVLHELDFSQIPRSSNYLPTMKDLGPKTFAFKGKPYAAPYIWGINGLIYNQAAVPAKPESWEDLLSSKYKGKIALMDNAADNYVIWSRVLGYDSANLTRAQYEQVTNFLIDLKTNHARTLAGSFDDIADQLGRGDLWACASGTWIAVPQLAKAKGGNAADIAWTLPTEGGATWIDGWTIPKDAPNVATAYAFIDYMLGAKPQAQLAEGLTSGAVVEDAVPLMSKENRDIYPYKDEKLLAERAPVFAFPPPGAEVTYSDWVKGWTRVQAS